MKGINKLLLAVNSKINNRQRKEQKNCLYNVKANKGLVVILLCTTGAHEEAPHESDKPKAPRCGSCLYPCAYPTVLVIAIIPTRKFCLPYFPFPLCFALYIRNRIFCRRQVTISNRGDRIDETLIGFLG